MKIKQYIADIKGKVLIEHTGEYPEDFTREMKEEITLSENQTFKPFDIKAIRFERNERGDFINAIFYTTDDRIWRTEVQKTEKQLIPDKIGSWLDVILTPTSKELNNK